MVSKSQLWALVEPLARARGLEIFEIEMPAARVGSLRIFLSRAVSERVAHEEQHSSKSAQGVSIDDCAAVSKDLSALLERPEYAEIGSWLDSFPREVSSPGINRKLSRPEHFVGALGERVRLKVRPSTAMSAAPAQPNARVMLGKLLAFDGATVELEEENGNRRSRVPFESIDEARVDFRF